MQKHCLPMIMLGLVLAGCNSLNDIGAPTVAEVQSTGVRNCAFLPTKETVEKIITARPAELGSSAAVAEAICAAVATARRGSVAGVPIEGLKVR